MTWEIEKKLTIFSITFMMIFALIPPSFADETIVIEGSIDELGDITPILLYLDGVDDFSVLEITHNCGNSDDPSNILDPYLEVVDPNGVFRTNDDGLAASDCAGEEPWKGSILVYLGAGLIDGQYTIIPKSYCDVGSDAGCPDTGVGPYTVTISLTGSGNISTEFGEAPPSDPPNDVPKGKKDLMITPDGKCDALQKNPGKGQGKDRALANNCGPVAKDDSYEFIDFITFENVLDNDVDTITGDNSELTVTGTSNVINNLPSGSLTTLPVSPDGSFGILCATGEGTLTFTYTVENLSGISDTADVTVTCVD